MSETGKGGLLLVDPDPGERGRLAGELEASGWRVWVAADAGTAVRVYAERADEIRAVVVDLQLPGLQGARILIELGGLAPGLTRVAIAAGVSPRTAAAFHRLSPTPLFAKPVRARDLDTVLRELAAVTV